VTAAMPREPAGPGIVSVRLASDDQPYIEADFMDRLAAAVAAVKDDASVRVVLLEGGSRYFCAGASRASLLRPDAGREVPRYAAELPLVVLDIPVPTSPSCPAMPSGEASRWGSCRTCPCWPRRASTA